MTDVKPEAPVSPEAEPEETVVEPVAPKPGEKTDPALLLESLKEERAKNRQLETELAELKSSPGKSVELSEEGRVLDERIRGLEATLATNQENSRLNALQATTPALKDKAAEFEAYRQLPENKGMSLETAAKAFLVENDLLTPEKPRKGLEKPSGGERTPQKRGMTPEEADTLRNTNYREYVRRLKAGELEIV